MKTLKTMQWLVKREFWEQRGMFYLAPIRLGMLMIAVLIGSLIYGHSTGVNSTFSQPIKVDMDISIDLANTYMGISIPIFMMLGFIVFFYCLGALFEERRDRSILFWKSLPLSDQQTVFSKVFMALVVAPMICIAVGIITSIIILIIICIETSLRGVNVFGLVFGNVDFYLAPLRLIGMWPVYILWAIPTVGWLLLVSAWAKSKVFLWAVLMPVIGLVVLKVVDQLLSLNLNINWISQNILARFLGGLFPGIWGFFEGESQHVIGLPNHANNMGSMLSNAWMSLAHIGVWASVAVGLLMIFAAIKMRRWREEN